MPIDNFVTEHKFDALRSMNGDVINNVAISGNMVFTLQHDLRTKPEDIIIENKAEVKTRGLSFTCVATTHEVSVFFFVVRIHNAYCLHSPRMF